jgi:hypothetical protein
MALLYTQQEWQANVFDRYLPCNILYEDLSVTESFVPGKHCSISFTHQAAKGMTMDLAKKYAENIVAILHKGAEPPITAVHADRLGKEGLPPLMPAAMLKGIPALQPTLMNAQLRKAAFPFSESAEEARPSIRVERISTCMGCVVATCVVDASKIAALNNALVTHWARPIVEAQMAKTKVCLDWRKSVELGVSPDNQSNAAAAAATTILKEGMTPVAFKSMGFFAADEKEMHHRLSQGMMHA